MAKIREEKGWGIAIMTIMVISMLIYWFVERIVNSTLIAPLPCSNSNFIECSDLSAGFDQLATRLSDAILFVIIVLTIFFFIALVFTIITIPYKWILNIIFGLYVLSITLLGYHALTNLAAVIQLLIDRYNGHFVDPKVECTSGMSFFGSLIAFLFHILIASKFPDMINTIDEDVMNVIKKVKESIVIKKEQKAAKKNIEVI